MLLLSLFLTIVTYQLTVFMLYSFPAIVIRDGLLLGAKSEKLLLSEKSDDDPLMASCKVSAACGACQNLTEEGGVIQSANFPNEYSSNLNCLYTISAPTDKKIILEFTEFIVEDCCDFISVFDGVAEPIKVGLRGYNLPAANISSSTNQMTIKFSTNVDNGLISPNVTQPARWQAVFKFL